MISEMEKLFTVKITVLLVKDGKIVSKNLFFKKSLLIILCTLALSLLPFLALAALGTTIQPEPIFSGQNVNPKENVELESVENANKTAPVEPAVKDESGKSAESGTDKNDVYKAVLDENVTAKLMNKYKNFTAREYVLGPNDIININITGVPELSQRALRVNPEGKINIMYLNNLSVAGLTMEELSKTIAGKYKEYIINPEIVVSLEQSRPFIVYVSGAVKNPGSYELNTVPNTSPYITKPEAYIERKTPLLSNILLAAGGISFDADIEHVKVTNEFDGSVFDINLYNMISESDFAQDLFLMGGDKVIVPRLPSPVAVDEDKYRLLAKSTLFQKDIPVRVIGYVNNPGLVRLDSAESANVNSAIAAAGGYITNYGNYPEKVYVSRLDNNNKLVTRSVNPLRDDIAIMPNDIVYIPEKTIPLVGKFFDYASRLMGPFGTFSNTYQSWDNMIK